MTLDPVGPRLGRRAQLRAERRKQRRRLTVAGLAVLALLLAVVTVVLVRSGGDSGKKVGAQKRTQRTVLLQVTDGSGTAVASALLAHDPAGNDGAVVLVPPQVLANVPGIGSLPFGKALQRGGTTGARNGLSDLMGVTIDGSWQLDSGTFQRLVDQEGGIEVDVDTMVLSGRTVLLQPGRQHVDGAHALAFATYLAPGEQEQSRLARLQEVVDGIVAALPARSDALLGSLGAGSQVTVSRGTLSTLLTGLKKADAAQQVQYQSLPVIKVDTGSDETLFRIDAAASQQMVDQLLAQSVPPGARATGNRVLVLNGVGTPGLGEKVRAKLIPAGFVFVGSRNAPSFGYAQTQVLVKDATTAGSALGARVAKALGVPASSVATSDQIGTIADVIVIVGRDFRAP
ncbi:MAG: LCP family protein [Mycobacteriales bacterium]